MNSEARSKVGDWEQRNGLSEISSLFTEAEPEQLSAILEEHLCSALRLEAEAEQRPEAEFDSHWRHAVEQSGQDLVRKYKDYLLASLRDNVEAWAEREPASVQPVIERYLREKQSILRRLGFHILSRLPKEYSGRVSRELKRSKNFDDLSIHHEFFQLLGNGYPALKAQDQKAVIDLILRGPRLKRLRVQLESQGEQVESMKAYLKGYAHRWIRDRLSMIRDYLDKDTSAFFESLVVEQGKADHPDFLSWSSFSGGAIWGETMFFQEEELTSKPPGDLVALLREWTPDQATPVRGERPSFRDFAFAVASATSQHLSRYSTVLGEIALLRPEFADALVNRLLQGEEVEPDQWTAGVELSLHLLRDERVRTDVNRVSDVCWVDVRRSIARSLSTQLEKATHQIEKMNDYVPINSLPRVSELLWLLLRDADIGPNEDNGEVDSGRVDDPLTISMNHVRPIALAALLDYELCRLFRSPDSSNSFGPSRLDPAVRDALVEELTSSSATNRSLHSVFGRYLIELTWLNEAWTLAHLDSIFPSGDSPQDNARFGAAFIAFVWRRRERIYKILFDALQPTYRLAIENLEKGNFAKSAYEGLAAQLLCDFVHGDIDVISGADEESLIAEFFRRSPADVRAHAAWMLWDFWKSCPAELMTKFWGRVRLLWAWRVGEASRLNHPADLDGEMNWYANLAGLAPSSETLASLWPLLEGLLPHLCGVRRGHLGWGEMESYIATQIEHDRLRAIKMYRLMHERRRGDPTYSLRYENERKILQTALRFPDSREEALAIINLIASKEGSDRHRDLYEQYHSAPY